MKRILTLALSLALLAFGVAQAGTFHDVGSFEQMLQDANKDGEFNGRTIAGHIDYSASAATPEVELSASILEACKTGYIGLDQYVTCPN